MQYAGHRFQSSELADPWRNGRAVAGSAMMSRGEATMKMTSLAAVGVALLVPLSPAFLAHAQVPDAIAAPGETMVTTIHAEGAQVYECKADAAGKLSWQFREPIATLIADGKTVGRHYAGPSWELTDGSLIIARV